MLVALLALAIYVLLPQLGDFRSSWQQLQHPALDWTALAIALSFGTYLAAAATYYLLALKPLRYGRTVLVQLAAMFINRLLPAGIGALGANYAYLRHSKHSSGQAAGIVAFNNLLGFAGHSLLVGGTLLAFRGQLQSINKPALSHGLAAWAVAAVMIVLIIAIVAGRERFRRTAADVKQQFQTYGQRPFRTSSALLSSIALTLCNVLALYACAQAFSVHLAFSTVLIIFTFGISLGTAVPTPGGLGGFEAGLVAGFVAYHVPNSTALAAALLYRLISYWLALLAGSVAFVICDRRRLLQT